MNHHTSKCDQATRDNMEGTLQEAINKNNIGNKCDQEVSKLFKLIFFLHWSFTSNSKISDYHLHLYKQTTKQFQIKTSHNQNYCNHSLKNYKNPEGYSRSAYKTSATKSKINEGPILSMPFCTYLSCVKSFFMFLFL